MSINTLHKGDGDDDDNDNDNNNNNNNRSLVQTGDNCVVKLFIHLRADRTAI